MAGSVRESSAPSPPPLAEYVEPRVQYLILQILGAEGLDCRQEQAVYATVKFGGTEARTRIIVGQNKEVRWAERFIFPIMPSDPKEQSPDVVRIAVLQVQRGLPDHCIGRIKVSLADVEKMTACPNVMQSVLEQMKEHQEILVDEVRSFTTRREMTFEELSKAAALKLAARFSPAPMRRRTKSRAEDDNLFLEPEAEEPPPKGRDGEEETLAREPTKPPSPDHKPEIQIHVRSMRLEEVDTAQEEVGTLKVEVLRAEVLLPITPCSPFVVLQHDLKWVRFPTVKHTTQPEWGMAATFPVRELSSVLRIAVFVDKQIETSFLKNNDVFVGKVRLRLSTLDLGRRYVTSFPLLRPGQKRGVLNNGTIEVAITLETALSALQLYQRVLSAPLPAAYYDAPETLELYLSAQRMRMENVMTLLAAKHPPLRKEVTAQTMDEEEPPFDLQRAKVNIARFVSVKNWVAAQIERWDRVCEWENPLVSIVCQALWVFFVYHDQMIAPCLMMLLLAVSTEHYLRRQTGELPVPLGPDFALSSKSCSDPVVEHTKSTKSGDKEAREKERERDKERESEERAETWEDYVINPIARWESQLGEAVSIVSTVQNTVGDIASCAERLANLVTWVDPRASTIFVAACFSLAVVLAVVPIRLVLASLGLFAMRHPRLRDPKPPPPVNLFLRLPTRLDQVYDWITLSAMKKGPQRGAKCEDKEERRPTKERRTSITT